MPQGPPPPRKGVSARGRTRNLSFVGVLRDSLRLLASHAWVLIPVAILLFALPTGLQLARIQSLQYRLRHLRDLGWLDWEDLEPDAASFLADWIPSLVLQAMVAFAIAPSVRGTPARWGAPLEHGLRRMVHALAAGLLCLLMLVGPCVLVLLWGGARGIERDVEWFLPMALAWLGFLATRAGVAVQVAVVEGTGPLRAVVRSFSLTSGVSWRILAIVIVVYALPFLATCFVRVGPLFAGSVEDTLVPRLFVEQSLDVLCACLQAVTAAVVYHALRDDKEGAGGKSLLAVFE